MHFIDTHQDRARCALHNGTSIGRPTQYTPSLELGLMCNCVSPVSLTLTNTPPEVHVVYCSLHVDQYTRPVFTV